MDLVRGYYYARLYNNAKFWYNIITNNCSNIRVPIQIRDDASLLRSFYKEITSYNVNIIIYDKRRHEGMITLEYNMIDKESMSIILDCFTLLLLEGKATTGINIIYQQKTYSASKINEIVLLREMLGMSIRGHLLRDKSIHGIKLDDLTVYYDNTDSFPSFLQTILPFLGRNRIITVFEDNVVYKYEISFDEKMNKYLFYL